MDFPGKEKTAAGITCQQPLLFHRLDKIKNGEGWMI